MSVDEYAITISTGRVNISLEFLGYTNPPIYHADELRMYRKFPNMMDNNVAELVNYAVQ